MLRERRIAVPEEHVIALWLRELRPERVFLLRDGRPLRVIDPGRRNRHDGPDFLDATVVIDGRLQRGAVEVHTREGDWQRHGHGDDVRYREVVLHVCLYAEAAKRPDVPLLVLATSMDTPLRTAWAAVRKERHAFPCAVRGRRVPAAAAGAMLALTAAERFGRKCARLRRRHDALCAEHGAGEAWRQLLYEAVARAVGYGGNENETEALAVALPLSRIASVNPVSRHMRILAAAGLRSGDDTPLFEKHTWRSARVMPRNRVRHRLRWFAAWCARLEHPAWWRDALALLRDGTRDAARWEALFAAPESGETPGRARVGELLVNVCAPLFRIYGETRDDRALAREAAALYFTFAPAAQNRHTRAVAAAFERDCSDAQDQQGMTELHGNFCSTERCHACLCHAPASS